MTSEQAHNQGTYKWTFGDRLRKIRRVNGLTQDEFAESLGVKKQTLAAWELDSWLPRGLVAFAKRIHLAYGTPVEWILGLDQPTGGPDDGGVTSPTRRTGV